MTRNFPYQKLKRSEINMQVGKIQTLMGVGGDLDLVARESLIHSAQMLQLWFRKLNHDIQALLSERKNVKSDSEWVWHLAVSTRTMIKFKDSITTHGWRSNRDSSEARSRVWEHHRWKSIFSGHQAYIDRKPLLIERFLSQLRKIICCNGKNWCSTGEVTSWKGASRKSETWNWPSSCGSSKQREPRSKKKKNRMMTKQDLPARSKKFLKGDQEETKKKKGWWRARSGLVRD